MPSDWEIEMQESREWLPRLCDVIHFATEGTEDEQEYFSRFGFDQLVIPAECTHVTARFSELTERFNERYLYRRIGQETMPRWQVRLQNRMDSVVRRYERAYALYEQYAQEMDDDMIEGEVTRETGFTSKLTGTDTRTTSSSSTGSDSDTGVTKNIDTPQSEVNANDDYADSYSKSTSSSTRSATGNGTDSVQYGRNDAVDRTITRTLTGRQIMENINLSIESWMDIDTAFVAEFENLFINVFE